VQAIVDSMKANPNAWRSSNHELYIGGDLSLLAPIRIWIANGEDFVRLETPPFVRFAEADRKAIWEAFQAWQARESQTEDFIAALKAAEETSGRIPPSESGDSARKSGGRDRQKTTAKRSKLRR
jgi:hypothetical protein